MAFKKDKKETLLQQLYELYIPIKVYLKRLCHEDHLEEILQETMVSAWKHIGDLKDSEKLESWVRAIARNEVNSFYNRESKIQSNVIYLEAEELEGAAGYTLLDDHVMYEKMKGFVDEEIYAMIERLGEPASTIVALHYGYKDTYEEIGTLLGMNAATVRTIARRSRKKLQEMLEEERNLWSQGKTTEKK